MTRSTNSRTANLRILRALLLSGLRSRATRARIAMQDAEFGAAERSGAIAFTHGVTDLMTSA